MRRYFDEYDQSGGGGFIDQSNLSLVLSKAKCEEEISKQLVVQDVVTWHDLWSAVKKVEFEKREGEEQPGTAKWDRAVQPGHRKTRSRYCVQ